MPLQFVTLGMMCQFLEMVCSLLGNQIIGTVRQHHTLVSEPLRIKCVLSHFLYTGVQSCMCVHLQFTHTFIFLALECASVLCCEQLLHLNFSMRYGIQKGIHTTGFLMYGLQKGGGRP